MTFHDYFFSPFLEFSFMRRALVAIFALALGGGSIGLLLVMRRMSLLGDAMSHAVLPGAAIGYMLGGLSLPFMSLGGFIAGLLVALCAALATRYTDVKEDASFAAFYLISLSSGVLLVSISGSSVDLMHILFGSVLGVDNAALFLVASVASVTVLALAFFYRLLLVEAVDPLFLRAIGAKVQTGHLLFLTLVVLNLVAGFQALGTLMSVGLMMLPPIIARLWVKTLEKMLLLSVILAASSGYGGLLLSYHHDLPSGPAIILLLGFFYVISLFVAPVGGVLFKYLKGKHYRTS
jgi:zinc/manganese transport system permease protein